MDDVHLTYSQDTVRSMTARALALCALLASLAVPAAARADVTPVVSGSATSLTGPAAFSLTVPAGSDRLLAVGISTTANVTVSSVSFGAQVLTRQQQVAEGGVRSETWTLVAPNVGTANVIVTLSGPAPIIAGAVSYAGVDQLTPIITAATGFLDNTSSNAASFVTSGTVAKDAMFGTIVVSPVANTSGEIFTQGSVDLEVADNRWATSTGTIRGAGSTRRGWTGANLSTNAGIVWRWQRIDGIIPYAFSWVALKAAAGTTPPTVGTPTATGISQTSATLGGTVSATGGSPITGRGVVVCQCADPVLGAPGVTAVSAPLGQDTNPFTAAVTGLTAARTYTYRAYASNAAGTGYSATGTFNTLNTPPTASAGGPYSATEDSALTLSGSGTDADGDALTYSWDVNGDGTYGDVTGATPALNRATREALGVNDGPASFNVRVRVSDGKDTTTSAATTLTLADTVPSATVGNSGPVNEGSTATVSFSNVTDPSGADTAAGFRYAYDFNNDGAYEIGGSTYAASVAAGSATVPASFLADGPGSRTVRMVVFDKDSGGHLYTTTITVNNVAPTGTLAGQTVAEGQTATVGLANVADPGDLATLRYAYDVDGNATDDTAAATYAGASTATTAAVPSNLTADGPAAVPVRVRVLDKDGASNVYTATLTVGNVAPTAKLGDVTVDEGARATVGLTDVVDPADAANVRYVYDLDGNATDDTAGVAYAAAVASPTADVPAALTADGPATVLVRVRVIDKDGGSNVYTADVDVTNVDPTATLADVTTPEGTPATVTFTGADDASAADTAGLTFEWDLDGDGTYTPGGESIAVPAPDGPATRSVEGAVLDRDGGRRAYTATVTVTNAAPVATITGPEAVPSSGQTTLTLRLSDSGDDTLTSSLDWGDGTVETVDGAGEKTVTHTYAAAGAKTITLVATDSDGARSAVATHALTVAATPAAPAPSSPTSPAATARQTITGVKVTPRCLRADDLRATIAKTRTMKVRFRLGVAAPVRITLQRRVDRGGASKCPPPRGVMPRNGRRLPGIYRPFTDAGINVRAGVNTITVAATGRKGRRLAPGTYLVIVESGGVRARTKLWVLDR
jgi:hypothetical protein